MQSVDTVSFLALAGLALFAFGLVWAAWQISEVVADWRSRRERGATTVPAAEPPGVQIWRPVAQPTVATCDGDPGPLVRRYYMAYLARQQELAMAGVRS